MKTGEEDGSERSRRGRNKGELRKEVDEVVQMCVDCWVTVCM